MENIQISNTIKEFIETHIDLIENKDITTLYGYIQRLMNDTDIINLWKVLKKVIEPSDLLKHLDTIPYMFYAEDNIPLIEVPPQINRIYSRSIYNCSIDTLNVKSGSAAALLLGSYAFEYSSIRKFIIDRDLYLKELSFAQLEYVKQIEIYGNIYSISNKSPFDSLYDINPNIKFKVSGQSTFNVSHYTQSLYSFLKECGFKNFKIV